MSSSNKNQRSQKPGEQLFSILPHPAKSNNPEEVNNPQGGPGFSENPAIQAHRARDPYIPNKEMLNSLEKPLSREELKKRAEELNKASG